MREAMAPVVCSVLLASLSLAAGCSSRPSSTPTPQATEPELIEMLPGVRVDLDRGIVEFDAVVAVDCHDPETPDVYLEVVCCTRDTREHEALVVTTTPPSSVHVALLLLGGTPGAPGSWRQEGSAIVAVPPTGEGVRVTFLTTDADGTTHAHDPAKWIIQKETGHTLRETLPGTGWVFAGSRVREFRGREVYDADGTGQFIGLHTFGSEAIAWLRIESPEAGIDEPQWMANAASVPVIGTPVTVRLELIEAE